MIDRQQTPPTHNPESYDRGFLGTNPNPEARLVLEHERLGEIVEALRTLGLSIVLTSGSFDLVHIGHARYLEKAKTFGDILVVGVDSDMKVKKRKDDGRPVVPEGERVQMLAHLRSVDLITIKNADDNHLGLIDTVKPDTLIVTEGTYDDDELEELSGHCGRVEVLARQATTSTSARIRQLQIGWSSEFADPINKLLEESDVDEATRRAIASIVTSKLRP